MTGWRWDPDELRDPSVVPIEDEFSALPEEERGRRHAAWVKTLRQEDEPLKMDVTAAELVAEARAEMGW